MARDSEICCMTPGADDRIAALNLMFQHLGQPACRARIANVLDLIALGEIDPDGILIAKRDSEIHGAIACLPMPGASALVWPPRGENATFDLLIIAGLAWLQTRGIKLAQTILADSDAGTLAPLQKHGFVPAGPMHFFRHPLTTLPESAEETALQLQPMTPVPADIIAETLQRTYHGTLDFPEMSDIRTIDDVMASYRTNPTLRLENSRLALSDDEPVGIFLLCELETLGGWDLTYLGVVPERRRRGVAKALVQAALHIAADAGAAHLDVAVDARNGPAIQLYSAAGFQLFDRRLVSLRFLANCP